MSNVSKKKATILPATTTTGVPVGIGTSTTGVGVPVATAISTVSRGLDRIEAAAAGTSSAVLVNVRLGAADLGVTILLTVLALDPRIWDIVSM